MKKIKMNPAMIRYQTRAALLALAASSVAVMGQYQFQNQIDTRVNTSSRAPLDRQIPNELYGNGGGNGSIRYAGSQRSVLPSELRYTAISSGATPSEIKAQANAVGPLPPGG